MARISIVVPVYNVEEYLRECLDSVAAQSFADLEVVMVDDGSTDGSAAIAQEFADADPRFRLITQPNGGLGRARNTGADAATGEFMNFLDSDDILPKHAMRTLLRSLDKTGSDFATGNVHRFGLGGSSQAPFVARAFTRTRPKTHITQFRGLLVDRIAPNKLFRRTFWDKHGFRFPEGVTHEDIPVVVPAHFLAKTVDVIADPVYLYRLRETGGLSITQRRLEPKVLRDRLSAVSHVSQFLKKHRRRAKGWYDHSVVAEDLRYYLNVLPHADEAYRQLFLDEVNAFLDTISPKAFEPLTAIERLKWQLVRQRLMPQLLEVIRFQREDLAEAVPVELDGRWYGDYPYREQAAELGIPLSAYELRQELTLAAQLDRVYWDGDRAHIEGSAFITAIGAPTEQAQKVTIVALRAGRFELWRRVRRRVPWLGIRVRTEAVHRPELTAETRQRLVDVSWAGFHASVAASQLTRLRFGRSEQWELYADVHAGRATRRTTRFATSSGHPVRGADRPTGHGGLLRVAPSYGRRLTLELKQRWAMVDEHAFEDGAVVLRGELHGYDGALKLELFREDDQPMVEYPLEIDRSQSPARFSVRVAPADLLLEIDDELGGDAADENAEQGIRWQLRIVSGRRRENLAIAESAPIAAWPVDGLEVALHRAFTGDGALVVRTPEPLITAASWTAGGTLVVRGTRGAWDGPLELVLHAPGTGAQHGFALEEGVDGAFTAQLPAAAIPSLAGPRPLRQGPWHLCARRQGETDEAALAPVVVARALLRALPLETRVAHKPFALGAMAGDRALLVVERDLDDDERGTFHQGRLVETAYRARRKAPLRDAVFYSSFNGRQRSDSPLAIQEELARRGAPLEHLWVGHDGLVPPPEGATLLRAGSREHHEALATARYVVTNDHLPESFARRDDQVVLQTWHGTPLKRLGLDIASAVPTQRRFEGALLGESREWQHVLSPSPYATEILRRAYAIEGEIHETGLPRVDRLAAPGREERSRAVRERLGIAEGTRVVLYAPTFRDHVIDRRGRPRLGAPLDIAPLRAALGPDAVVLFRKHHLVVDPVPTTADGFLRDASSYPDGTELLLAADVLVTDYSASLFDFAVTGRPIVLFAHDLETYRDEVRGLYLDLEEIAPGPVVRDVEALAAALADPSAPGTDRAAFLQRFCPHDDGSAAARAVDHVFGA